VGHTGPNLSKGPQVICDATALNTAAAIVTVHKIWRDACACPAVNSKHTHPLSGKFCSNYQKYKINQTRLTLEFVRDMVTWLKTAYFATTEHATQLVTVDKTRKQTESSPCRSRTSTATGSNWLRCGITQLFDVFTGQSWYKLPAQQQNTFVCLRQNELGRDRYMAVTVTPLSQRSSQVTVSQVGRIV